MKFIAIALLLLFTTFSVGAGDFPTTFEIIEREGRFIFTDGSSFYLFKKDGAFKSEPLGLSGRVIDGTWKRQDELFIIQGRWSWMNGLSAKDDYRKMILYLGAPVSSEIVERLSPSFGSSNVKIYKCYFEVEELQKTAKPAP